MAILIFYQISQKELFRSMLLNRHFLFLWFVNIATTLAIELFTVTILVTIYAQTESTLLVAGIYLILVALSTADVFHRPARMALIPSLVSQQQLVRANSFILASTQIIMAISYMVGGWLILALPLCQIAIGVVILFALAALAAMLIAEPKREEIDVSEEKESFWQSLTSGWKYLRQHPIARALTVMETIEHLPHGIWTGTLMLAFITKALQGDAVDWGYQVTGYFAGMILGSLLALTIGDWLRRYTGRIIMVNAFAAAGYRCRRAARACLCDTGNVAKCHVYVCRYFLCVAL